jgi:shikimate kinase/3-dehydroquinate synthase
MNQLPSAIKAWIYLYGPPGVGKTALGRRLAKKLALPFYELDQEIEAHSGRSIPTIFSENGEAGFRIIETKTLRTLHNLPPGIVALGGGALLDENNRHLVESNGMVLCLQADFDTLLARTNATPSQRPLLTGDHENRLKQLLSQREDHYASFPVHLNNSHLCLIEAVWESQIIIGRFQIQGMKTGYPVVIGQGYLDGLGPWAHQVRLGNPTILVVDDHVSQIYGNRVLTSISKSGYTTKLVHFPAGETNKNLATVQELWDHFATAGLERRSTVFALGGGVTGDLAGYAAASYMRGIAWCAVPTTLLAMVDASLGGKTGFDLPQGKNLVGAFHSPSLVLVDPDTLSTLPDHELRSGLAEVVKAGIIHDLTLFKLCESGWQNTLNNMLQIVPRAMAVKMRIIQQDPYEQNVRASLNLGHTLGHAIEKTSGYTIPHGYAVAIGMVAACHLAELLNITSHSLVERITSVLNSLGLPIHLPRYLDRSALLQAMQVDKKRQDGTLRFVLPCKIGKVRTGVPVTDLSLLHTVLDQITK